ncbi:MAG: hypothetical protein NVSMB70_10350 [Chamaesiphon sp.]
MLSYKAPYHGAPQRTVGTGSRGAYYKAPYHGTPQRTVGTGSRGENASSLPLTLSLLIPTDHTGRTISDHPTFFFNLPANTDAPVEFTLVQPGNAKPVFVQQISAPKAGTMQIKLPKDQPGLVQGQKYRWSVSVVRNSKRRSDDVFVQGWIERVAATPEIAQQLATSTSEHQRAIVYAQAGIFYDALTAISSAQSEAPTDRSIQEDRLSLLQQVGQTQLLAQEEKKLMNK